MRLWFPLYSDFKISLGPNRMLETLSSVNEAYLLSFKVSKYAKVSNTLYLSI
jgi:hypothetical protein